MISQPTSEKPEAGNSSQWYEGKRVLITGGAGFIGSNLAHRLVQMGAQVTVVDAMVADSGSNPFNLDGLEGKLLFCKCDLRNSDGLAELVRGQDYIFNLAGQVGHLASVEDPLGDLDSNCRAHVGLLELCRHADPKPRVVYASTRQIYGRPKSLPVDEGHGVAPVDPNGISKLAGEYYHLLYSGLHGVPASSLRLTNTYGPRMRVQDARQTFIGWWFRQVLEGKEILVYGDGEQLRDLNFVDDVVDAFLLAGTHPAAAGEAFNLGAAPVSLNNLAKMLIEMHGRGSFRNVPFPKERKNIDIGDYYGDYRRIGSALGWKPVTELRAGLCRTLEYFKANAEHYW